MVAAEAGSAAKTGGLADAVWGLARALVAGEHGGAVDFLIHIVIPKYRSIEVGLAREVSSGTLRGIEPAEFKVLESQVDGIVLNYVESEPFSKRAGIYGDTANHDYGGMHLTPVHPICSVIAWRFFRKHWGSSRRGLPSLLAKRVRLCALQT